MPRFTTSLLFGILVIMGLLSASSRGTSTPAAHGLATAAGQDQGPTLDRRAIFKPRPRPDTPDPSFPDLGPGSRPGGLYPGDPPRKSDKKNENELPEPPDGNAATTPAAAATQPSIAQCTSAYNLNTAASGTASPETPSRASQTQGPASSESAGQSARLSQAAAGMALPLLLLLLLHLLA